MGNPPGWVGQTLLQAPRSEVHYMSGVAAGLVTAGEVNTQPMGDTGMGIAHWSTVWFVVAVVYLASIYWGHLSVASTAS